VSERQYVGIDLHRRRSVIVRVDRDGKHLSTVRVPNGAIEMARAVEEAGPFSWGSQGAFGQGTWGYDDCRPDCANGTVTNYPATVTPSTASSR